MRPVAALLLIAAALPAAELQLSDFEAPQPVLQGDGSILLPAGFVLRKDEALVMGDAARIDLTRGIGYARGSVVLVRDGVRIEAERLGWRGKEIRSAVGEAWNARVEAEHDGRTLRFHAEHVRFGDGRIVLEGVRGDLGHGAAIDIAAATVTIWLRGKPAPEREGFERRVAAIEVTHLRTEAAGIPFLYLPWAMRDFTRDYPWTRFRAGKTLRQGYFARYWIGTPLPEVAGWRTGVVGRVERNTRAGNAGGLAGSWQHARWGNGDALWFGMPEETLTLAPDDRDEVGTRTSHTSDLSHRAAAGGFATSARWLTVPEDDPWVGQPPTWERPGDRYRSDYLRDEMESRPYARRGVAAAYGGWLGTVTVDTEHRIHPDDRVLERLAGVQAILPHRPLLGPVGPIADAWVEQLQRAPGDGTVRAATRLSGTAGLAAAEFVGPIGLSAQAGWNALGYADGSIDALQLDDAWRWVPTAVATARLRLVSDAPDAVYTHRITPRLGVELLGRAHGDELPAYGFGDPRDDLESDRQYLRTGFDTVVGGPAFDGTSMANLFRADVEARWALRDEDRVLGDDVSSGPLVDVTGTAEGRPVAWFRLRGSAVYDLRPASFTQLDADADLDLSDHVRLRYTGTLLPADETWQHRPGVVLALSRYRVDAGVLLRPGGEPVDTWSLGIGRHSVDGIWTLSYEFVRDEDGAVYDRRVGLGFVFGHAGTPSTEGDAADTDLVFGAR